RMQHAGGTPCGCAIWRVPTWFILSWALSPPEASDDGDHGRTSDDVTRRLPQAGGDGSSIGVPAAVLCCLSGVARQGIAERGAGGDAEFGEDPVQVGTDCA